MIAIRARIEQAVASGWSLDRIIDELGVEPALVDAVLARMDRRNAETERPRR